MKPVDATLEQALFDTALNLTDDSARRQFLDRACNGDAGLRRRIEDLLTENTRAELFFDFSPADSFDAPASRTSASQPPNAATSAIGRYRILRKLGEGGCGIVYLAEQNEPVRREVALKVTRAGMDTADALSRFQLERQTLALMNHPNIARVFDAGSTEKGRLFFAMEVVHGARITAFAAAERLSLVDRIELFIQVCLAVQHAHQKGIIHRDLKPSNILVTRREDGVPTPKIIDFGVAKALAASSVELNPPSPAWLAGTPAYMSPEQMIPGGEVDTRSDIYSLGVLLFELLAETPLYDPASLRDRRLEEIRRFIRDTPPLRPSETLCALPATQLKSLANTLGLSPASLVSAYRRDLDWIVLRALSRERKERYATVQNLILDLQRHLHHDAVSAHPDSRSYRLDRWIRRHRIGFFAGCAVSLSIVAGAGLSTWLYLRERDAVRVQRQLRTEAEDAERITRALYLARDGRINAADEMLVNVTAYPDRPSFEGVTVYRSVGDWLAAQQRWTEAAQRLAVVQRFGTLDAWERTTRDHQAFGVALLAAGDGEGYRRFRSEYASRFAKLDNGDAVGRVLKVCALLPLDADARAQLQPLGERTEAWFSALPPDRASHWATIPSALWRYRLGELRRASEVAALGFDPADHASACTATQRVILALCALGEGRRDEAAATLDIARTDIERIFADNLPEGDSRTGFWYDWVFARILLQETTTLLGQRP
jgi:serine/threonine protein kinase